jgi:hypothetical protein
MSQYPKVAFNEITVPSGDKAYVNSVPIKSIIEEFIALIVKYMIDEPDTKHDTVNIKKYLEDNKKYIDTLCINNLKKILNPGQINIAGNTCNVGDEVFTDNRIDKILKNSKIKDVVRIFKAKNK